MMGKYSVSWVLGSATVLGWGQGCSSAHRDLGGLTYIRFTGLWGRGAHGCRPRVQAKGHNPFQGAPETCQSSRIGLVLVENYSVGIRELGQLLEGTF